MQKIIIALFLVTGILCHGQNSINGTVLDEQTQQPIVGAAVYIPELGKASLTNATGEFFFQDLSNGEYELVVSSLGYATESIRVNLPQQQELHIFVAPSAIEMEEVIISTPFHQLQSENVMKVERATMNSLEKSGAIGLATGITQIPGVSSITTGAGIGKPVIRGLSSNRVLVYTQGVRLENQQFGGEHGLGLNASGIESVEVIKGPATLLYGSDALGGILYLNPEIYAPTDSTQIDAKTTYFTNTEGMEANLGFKTSAEKLKFLVRGNYATHSDYETGEGVKVSNTRFNEVDLKSGISYKTKDYSSDLRYNFNSSKLGIPEEIGVQTDSKEIIVPYQQVDNHILSLDNTFYLDDSSLDLKIGYLFNNRKEFEGHHEEHHEEEHHEEEHHEEENHSEEHLGEHDEAALVMHLETVNYDAKYHLPEMGKFETIIGVQGMFQSNKNLGEEILIPNAFTTDFGILATTHYHLQKVDFQAGIRYDNRNIESEETGSLGTPEHIAELNRSFNSYNGAFGVKLDLLRHFTTRINIASGFRAPNLAELTSNGSHHGSNRYEVGNPELENEQNFQLDLALEYRNDHFEAFVNAFYNQIDDYIYLEPTGAVLDENPVFNYVQNNAKLYGGETGIHIHPHPLDWLHFESSFEMVIGKRDNGAYLPLIPAHSLTNTLRIETGKTNYFENGYGFLTLESIFDQDKVGNFETPTGNYSLVSAGLGASFYLDRTLLQLRLSGRNLLDETYISHLSRLKADGIANMGRNISLSMEVVF